MKSCCCKCNKPATFTLNVLLSSYGIRPRRQKTSQVVPLCSACLRGLFDMPVPQIVHPLLQAVNRAYTALTDGTKSLDTTETK